MKKIKKTIYVLEITHKDLRKDFTWTTLNGGNILLKDLKDNHLLNIIMMLQKKVDDIMSMNLPMTKIGGKTIEDIVIIMREEVFYRNLK